MNIPLKARAPLSFDAVGKAFGAWCRNFEVKELMRMFGVAEQTAKKWRQGNLPDNKRWVYMVEIWGQDFLLTIFSPALTQSRNDVDLDRDLEVMAASLKVMKEQFSEARHRLGAWSTGITIAMLTTIILPTAADFVQAVTDPAAITFDSEDDDSFIRARTARPRPPNSRRDTT